MSYMTRLPGVPDTDQALPGMAYFAGTGPIGKRCEHCKFRGLTRESRKSKWVERLQQFVHKTYRTKQCSMFKRLSGSYGAAVKADYPACKYFEPKYVKAAPVPRQEPR